MKNQTQAIESLKSMIESCFTYGGAKKTDYNYERYILPYRSKLSKVAFDKVYTQHLAYLSSEFSIKTNTYTDCEGLNYNSLTKN